MRKILENIFQHVGNLGWVDTIKLSSNADELVVEAMGDGSSVIIKGKFKDNAPDMDKLNGVFGLGNLDNLKTYLNAPNYKTDKASMEILEESRNGLTVPVEILFKSDKGDKSRYRLTHEANIPNQAKMRNIQLNWDISLVPNSSDISNFSYFATSVVGSSEPTFSVKTEKDKLKFIFGSDTSSSDSTSITFAEGITHNLSRIWAWQSAFLIKILKLADPKNIKLSICEEKGLLKIEIDSDIASYEYYMPGAAR